MKVIKPPQEPDLFVLEPSIFLAGSIEMGVAEDWQTAITKELEDLEGTIFNPRRDDWDLSWMQSIDNPQFREQVEWELDCLERADLIVLYFDPTTKSPISFLELGLHAGNDNMVVYCPEPFWRKGNVDIVCKRFGIQQAKSPADLIEYVRMWVSFR